MEIHHNVSLKPYNTFGLESIATSFVEINSTKSAQELCEDQLRKNQHVLILGGGSNILLVGDYHGIVVKNGIKGITVVHESDDTVTLQVGAGEIWHHLVQYCLDHGWGGLENLSLIPGTVGAAPMQNIGAYGVEIKEVFEKLEAVDRETGEVRVFKHEDCQFGYRHSVFKSALRDRYIITYVFLRLSKKPIVNTSYGVIRETLEGWGISHPSIREVSRAVIAIRTSKLPDPSEIGNAGSFFKNPVISVQQFADLKREWPDMPGYDEGEKNKKVPAGWLIEKVGFKGLKRGEVGTHVKQALVLVNHGKATGAEILKLAEMIRSEIRSKFGIDLVPEVNIISQSAGLTS